MTLEEQIKVVVDALAEKKAVDVKTYDVRGVSGLCDAFVVATGTAAPHLKALIAGTQRAMKEAGIPSRAGSWWTTWTWSFMCSPPRRARTTHLRNYGRSRHER